MDRLSLFVHNGKDRHWQGNKRAMSIPKSSLLGPVGFRIWSKAWPLLTIWISSVSDRWCSSPATQALELAFIDQSSCNQGVSPYLTITCPLMQYKCTMNNENFCIDVALISERAERHTKDVCTRGQQIFSPCFLYQHLERLKASTCRQMRHNPTHCTFSILLHQVTLLAMKASRAMPWLQIWGASSWLNLMQQTVQQSWNLRWFRWKTKRWDYFHPWGPTGVDSCILSRLANNCARPYLQILVRPDLFVSFILSRLNSVSQLIRLR